MKCRDTRLLDCWELDPEALLNLPDDHWVSEAIAEGRFYAKMPEQTYNMQKDEWMFFVERDLENSSGVYGDILVRDHNGFLKIYSASEFDARFIVSVHVDCNYTDDPAAVTLY